MSSCELPSDIYPQIFCLLPNDLGGVVCVCKRWNQEGTPLILSLWEKVNSFMDCLIASIAKKESETFFSDDKKKYTDITIKLRLLQSKPVTISSNISSIKTLCVDKIKDIFSELSILSFYKIVEWMEYSIHYNGDCYLKEKSASLSLQYNVGFDLSYLT